MKSISLGDLVVFNPSAPHLLENEELAFVPMACVSETGRMAVPETLAAADLKSGYNYMQNGDVLVAKITPCYENNKIAIADFRQRHGFGSTEFHVIRPSSGGLDNRFLCHFLRQDRVRAEGARRMTGSAGQRRIPRKFLEELKIPLPPLAEQRRIGAILNQADALRRKRREALACLNHLKRTFFEQMFGDPVANSKNWPRKPFAALLKEIASGWSPVCLDRPAQGGEWGVLKLSAVTTCEYDDSEQKALPPELQPKLGIEVKKGDLLFTRKNTSSLVAATALVRNTRAQLMLSDLIFCLRLNETAPIIPEFLHALLTWPSKRASIQTLAGGSAGSMPNISKEKLRNVEIELPPLELQRNFAALVAEIDKLQAAHCAHLEKLDALFAALQHLAFRGELADGAGWHSTDASLAVPILEHTK